MKSEADRVIDNQELKEAEGALESNGLENKKVKKLKGESEDLQTKGDLIKSKKAMKQKIRKTVHVGAHTTYPELNQVNQVAQDNIPA